MTRSILCGLLALLSVGSLGIVPIACQSGGVGDPCTPEDEYDSTFAGFNVAQEFIESRSFQCSTRLCLVNHFQGRVSCPFGQAAPTSCNGLDDTTTCGTGGVCEEAQVYSPQCTVCKAGSANCVEASCTQGLVCNTNGSPPADSTGATTGVCTCTASSSIGGIDYHCEPVDPTCKGTNCAQVLKSYVCHKPSNCQTGDATDTKNIGKECCIPGTETPVSVSVCGQCDANSKRNADQSVYCSCRCCPKCCDDPSITMDDIAAGRCEKDKTQCGSACDPNFNFCSCPTGFSCSEVRKNVGIADPQLTGSYCIKEDSAYVSDANCGNVKGYYDTNSCKGTGVSSLSPDGGASGG